MNLYEMRNGNENENFSDFVFRKMNEVSIDGKVKIPHFIGSLQLFPIPITEFYAQQALIVFKPWSKSKPLKAYNNIKFSTILQKFLESENCPTQLLIFYEQAKRRKAFMDKGVFHYEPTSKNAYDVDLDDMDFNGDISDEDRLLMFNNMFQQDHDPDEESKLPRGLSFDW